ncbi:T3SS effector NleG family protein [Escherichia coli]|nr:T3SS effector NleG family protein [Escherichia coli]
MRNSANSNVCSLYDKNVISQLISTNSLHPLSREPITVSMILEKSECYFSQNKDCFIVKSSLDNRAEQ